MAAVQFSVFLLFLVVEILAIYDPSKEIPKPLYTRGIKTHLQPIQIQYHQNYSKVLVHNNQSSAFNQPTLRKNVTKLFPVYNAHSYNNKPIMHKKIIELNSQISHNRINSSENLGNIVGSETFNHRIVYKRKIEKQTQIEVFHKCPSGKTGQFVYDLSCNQFLNCWKGRGGPENCAPGTLFNPKTLECDFPEKVECLTGPRESTLRTAKSESLKLEQATCPEGFSGLIPNYTDCTKFIRCNNGQQNTLDCPPGTLFDFTHNICDFPAKSTCFTGETANYLVGNEHGDQNLHWHSQNLILGPQTHSYGQGIRYTQTDTNVHSLHTQSVGSANPQGCTNCGSTSHSQIQSSNGCNPQIQNCGTSYNHQTSSNVQTTYVCDPQTQNCGYILPETYPNVASQSNVCNPLLQDCTTSQSSNVGPQPSFGYGTTPSCNPQVQNCGTTTQNNQNTYGVASQGHNQVAVQSSCNPLLQNCGSNVQSSQNAYGGSIQPVYGSNQTPYNENSLTNTNRGVQTSNCNPFLQNCGSNVQSGQNSYGSSIQPVYDANQRPYNQNTLGTENNQGVQIPNCNPLVQNCGSNVQNGQNSYGSSIQPVYGTNQRPYNQNTLGTENNQGVQLPNCNPLDQNCGSNVQNGQNSYGSSIQPVYDANQRPYNQNTLETENQGVQVPNCNPLVQKCGSNVQNGQNAYGSSSQNVYGNNHTPYNQNTLETANRGVQTSNCNPFLQNCGSNVQNGQSSYGSSIQPVYGNNQRPYNQNTLETANRGVQTSNCNPFLQNCGSNVHNGQSSYGSSIQPVYGNNQRPYNQNTLETANRGVHTSNCNPFLQNCGSNVQNNQDTYGTGTSTVHSHNQPPNNQNAYGNGHQVGVQPSCNPQIQNCGSNVQTSHGQHGSQQSTTNYNKICNINDKNCQSSQNQQPKCPQDFQGITKHPNDCTKFLNCANGITYIQDCAPGTLFNPLNNICDFPYNVDCKDNVKTVEESTTDDYGYESYGGGQYTTQKTTGSTGYHRQGFATVKPVTHNEFYGQNNQLGVGFRQPNVQESTTPTIVHIIQKPYHQISKGDRIINTFPSQRDESDYVDVFDPNVHKNVFSVSSTARSVWPPPFPTTDLNADYIFEYDDGEKVTLSPENEDVQNYKPRKCGKEDFHCNSNECVPGIAVCNGVKECRSGKDETNCAQYLEQFLPYRDSRLEVLEKQRWDNVSLETCAFLCMENKQFSCKSFNYRKKDKACFLTNTNIGLSGALKKYYPCDYFELKNATIDCTDMHKCPNHKCLTSNQICDGYDDCGDRADEKGCIPSDFGYEIRLAGSKNNHEGRIEVTAFGKTGYVCDDQFNTIVANVACKELGFELGALEIKANSFFARDIEENNTLYMMDDIQCIGNETSLLDCNFAGWGVHNCRDQEIVGVICKTPQEECGEDYWKCRTQNECVPYHFVCDNIFDCTDNSDESDQVCQATTELRLVNGSNPREGRVEVKYHGAWGSICDDDFNEDAAKVVCKHLGFSGKAMVKKEGYFGEGTGPIWLDQVYCFGNESNIDDCTHWSWGEHNCDHSEDVGVICKNSDENYERHSKNFEGDLTSKNKDSIEPIEEENISCGYRNDDIFSQNDDIHFRVVTGSLARKGDYPWQAALRVKGKEKSAHWCGAVIISSKWVLTAAHCLVGYSKGAYIVVAGEYDIDEEEGTEQHSYIEEYYIHEQFRKGGNKMNNDIALIRLKSSGFKLNKHVRPLCLPDEHTNYDSELNCTISGFGSVKHGKSAYSHALMAAWIPVQMEETCKMPHVYGGMITDGMVCAGFLDGGVDACDGDSGGPLACLNNGLFTLYGLTSWGHHCGYANKPGVYVKVAHYRRWIDEIILEHS